MPPIDNTAYVDFISMPEDKETQNMDEEKKKKPRKWRKKKKKKL